MDEHRVHVYASKDNNGTIVRANRPVDLFRNSIATPSLVAALIHGKFSNHIPFDRQAKMYQNSGIALSTNTMANWAINATDQYFSLIYDELHKQLYESKVIHADETSCQVIHDDRNAGSKSWMWVYRNGSCDPAHPIVIYDFQKTRRTDHPKEFLKDYSGTLVTDGYQVYHTIEKQRDDLQVAGCWVHAKRKFAELVKVKASESIDATVSAEAVKRISAICHIDNKLDGLSKEKREEQRKTVVEPLVDDYFAWAKKSLLKVPAGGATAKALNYSINQEQFLRVFLSNGDVPMDNNLAEQAIRPFTIGRKNWVTINSIRGAQSSAVMYSLVETAKANNLRIYEYLNMLLEELPKHQSDTNLDFLKNLMPWSPAVQERCHSLKKS